ncbi:Hsp20/alpha crystallin family protein [Inconstantimicrobium mannanitabidum]|uniref:Uncharacterized protein n=1 Tax=Inconstantimicrobium mannanitabidum TaxID=1604901 RepID=A0ACB5R737_9CLOT|nr:Hsp20/alpha crystallin family protein [Clostridium sp. TW13]GKX65007.1 hypothetical protein rsdtw13_02650 [Clostridium sp. TW13]
MNRIPSLMFNNIDIFNQLFNNIFLDGATNYMLSNNFDDNDAETEDSYEIEIKDYGDCYIIKGYLPGVSPNDMRIDFEKNKVILTIRQNHFYKNESSSFISMVYTNGNMVKSFDVEEIDKNSIRATFEEDTLFLTLPKKKPTQVNDEKSPIIIDVDSYEEK